MVNFIHISVNETAVKQKISIVNRSYLILIKRDWEMSSSFFHLEYITLSYIFSSTLYVLVTCSP